MLGCAACHVPELRTGSSASAALSEVPVPLFSDLLLHDVGTGDGIAQEDAGPTELRTAPLWGLGQRRPLLHDGRAGTVHEAIVAHGAEATNAAQAYAGAAEADREALWRS